MPDMYRQTFLDRSSIWMSFFKFTLWNYFQRVYDFVRHVYHGYKMVNIWLPKELKKLSLTSQKEFSNWPRRKAKVDNENTK